MRPVLFALCVVLAACGSEAESPKAGGSGKASSPSTKDVSPKAPIAEAAGLDTETAQRLTEALGKGRAFLAGQQQDDGAWTVGGHPDVGYTAMGALGLLAATDKVSSKRDPAILKALRYVVSKQDKERGAISSNPQYTNYHTSVSIGALASARIAEFAQPMNRAVQYLADTQIHGDEGDLSYGGFPYKQESKGQPADLSNAQFAAQALRDGNLPEDHVVWKRMHRFLRRVQSNSEGNSEVVTVGVGDETREIVAGNDGGAFYGPGSAGLNKGGMTKRPDGKWEFKSYGSMSYALLKCLIFSGVDVKDRRMQMVVKWIAKHFAVDRNPGFEDAKDPETAGQQGFFYYLYTAARALAEYEKATGEPLSINDADGRTRNWRKEMVQELLKRQAEDGSWQNEFSSRWSEGNQVLATSYALQCLAFVTGRLP